MDHSEDPSSLPSTPSSRSTRSVSTFSRSTRSSLEGLASSSRERIAALDRDSALNTSRLKYCILFHYLMGFIMLAKQTPFMLYKLNLMHLSIPDLRVHSPYAWEWVWMASIFSTFVGFNALKKESVQLLKYYMVVLGFFGYLPLIYGFFLWYNEVATFLNSNDYFQQSALVYWNGRPYGVFWHIFIWLAFQLHTYSMYSSYMLRSIWLADIRRAY